jgi:hypothetical protein
MTALNKLREEDWQALVYAIRKGKCILMLGPETAIEAVDGKPRRLSASLAKLLAENIKLPDDTNRLNLMEVARTYSIQQGGEIYLQNKTRNFYKERQTVTTPLHRDLAALPFSLVINASPDNMLHTALIEQNKNPGTGWYNYRHKKSYMETAGTVEEPMIFYLYGSIDDEDSLVLTEDDLLDFLVSISSKDTLPDRLLHELRSPGKSFLFLGFGFKYWYLRIILRIMGIRDKFSRSFALEDFKPANELERSGQKHFYREGPCRAADEHELEDTIRFYREGPYKIYFYEKDFDEFAGELRKHYEASEGTTPPVPPPVKEDAPAPRVFICHAHEDKAAAASLYKKLLDAGLEPWLDKENLRGGSSWDEQIKRTIDKEIDYFLVLQSSALVNKKVGYVNKEIYEARERQKFFRFGTRFIIPLRIDDCEVLEELGFLQTIDLHNGEETIDELIKIIKRDYIKRGKK